MRFCCPSPDALPASRAPSCGNYKTSTFSKDREMHRIITHLNKGHVQSLDKCSCASSSQGSPSGPRSLVAPAVPKNLSAARAIWTSTSASHISLRNMRPGRSPTEVVSKSLVYGLRHHLRRGIGYILCSGRDIRKGSRASDERWRDDAGVRGEGGKGADQVREGSRDRPLA